MRKIIHKNTNYQLLFLTDCKKERHVHDAVTNYVLLNNVRPLKEFSDLILSHLRKKAAVSLNRAFNS